MSARLEAVATRSPRRPRTPTHPWSRLALLAALATLPVLALWFVIAWLMPPAVSRFAEYPLADLKVGVPTFFRPFNMGGKAGRPNGIWLVRSETEDVSAFWSGLPRPNACGLITTTVEKHQRVAVGPEPNATPLPVRPGARTEPVFVPGFREPCSGSTFLLDGAVNFGPAWRDLDRFPATIESETIRIDTTRLVLGECRGYRLLDDCSTPEHEVTQRVTWPRP